MKLLDVWVLVFMSVIIFYVLPYFLKLLGVVE
jgi:hypothetical protein